MKLGSQTHFGAKSQSEGTIQLVPKLRKMASIIPWRQRGTWEGVPVATWCSEWICRTCGGLGPHILIIPASLSLPPMRGAAIGRAPTTLQNDSFYTRISNFVKYPILSTTSVAIFPERDSSAASRWLNPHCIVLGNEAASWPARQQWALRSYIATVQLVRSPLLDHESFSRTVLGTCKRNSCC